MGKPLENYSLSDLVTMLRRYRSISDDEAKRLRKTNVLAILKEHVSEANSSKRAARKFNVQAFARWKSQVISGLSQQGGLMSSIKDETLRDWYRDGLTSETAISRIMPAPDDLTNMDLSRIMRLLGDSATMNPTPTSEGFVVKR